MFGDVGRRMLNMMGFGTSVPGAIREEDVAQALDNLQQSLALMPEQVAATGEADENGTTREPACAFCAASGIVTQHHQG